LGASWFESTNIAPGISKYLVSGGSVLVAIINMLHGESIIMPERIDPYIVEE